MTTKHNEHCYQSRVRAKAWEKWFPKHCAVCQGNGFVYQPGDWVPYGATQAQLPGFDELCGSCVEAGVCPRCAGPLEETEIFLSEVFPDSRPDEKTILYVCRACNWRDTESPRPVWECECWVDELDELEARLNP